MVCLREYIPLLLVRIMVTSLFRTLSVSACLILSACVSTDRLQYLNGRNRQPINSNDQLLGLQASSVSSNPAIDARLEKQEREIRELQTVIAELSSNQTIAVIPSQPVSKPLPASPPLIIEASKIIPVVPALVAPMVANAPRAPEPAKISVPVIIPKYNYMSSNLNEVGVVSVASVVNSVVLKLADMKIIPVVVNVATKKPMPYRVVKEYVVIDDFADQPVFVVSLKGKSAVVRLNASINKELTAAPSSAAISSPKNAHFPVVFGRGSNIVKLDSFTRPNLLALKAAASNAKSVTVHTSGDENFTALMQKSQRNFRAKNIQRFLIRFCGIKKEQIAIDQSTIKQSTIIFNY